MTLKTETCGGVPVAQVTTAAGRNFRVRVVGNGDTYGVNGALTHDSDDPLVEFYDATYAGFDRFGPVGQFVARYYLTTLRTHGDVGLMLDTAIPEWHLDAAAVTAAVEWATSR